MKVVIIDGNDFNTIKAFHELLKLKMDLPQYYGNNLDALWDCLTREISLPLKIIWDNFDNSKVKLGNYASKAAEVFIKAEKELGDKFIFEIH